MAVWDVREQTKARATSAGKVMASVFWNARGIIHIDYLQKDKTINGEYYGNLLQRLNDEIKKKRPHLAKNKVLFCQDNAPVHISVIAMVKINELKFILLPLAPYSLDLAPSDYFLFPNLKKWLGEFRTAGESSGVNCLNVSGFGGCSNCYGARPEPESQ